MLHTLYIITVSAGTTPLQSATNNHTASINPFSREGITKYYSRAHHLIITG
ncbi:hypothetical protein [Alteromonas mediterranea]|uniref:hypothetical protein n=1 Tax=Alteromonas mediterranea TaxID=314275 RepID=UPI0002D2ADC5|nr:hypothetical protein [Gammaproteobacteria bacterium]CAH1217041.1 hypothetical protein ISS312_01652 [Alteromonas mediterranea]